MTRPLLRVARHPSGPRTYALGVRIHHGPPAIAATLVALALRRYRVAAVLAVIAAHDARDYPWRDCDNH